MKNLNELKKEYTLLLEETIKNLKAQVEVLSEVENENWGVVYVLRQANSDNYKIGYSTNLEQRKNTFGVTLPFKLEEVFAYKTKNFREVETELHRIFETQKLNNSEFFKLTSEQVESFPELFRDIDYNLDNPQKLTVNTTQVDSVSEPEEDRDAEMLEKTKELLKTENLSASEISVSFMQRKLSIGYARAARLKDRLLENANPLPDVPIPFPGDSPNPIPNSGGSGDN